MCCAGRRDVFVEQTVARLAQVARVADGEAGPVDEGIGPVVVTPIMRWLHSIEGPIEQFNQTMVLQAPAGVTEADVVVVLQALLDRHAMLRLRVMTTAPAAGHSSARAPGSVDADERLLTVDVLSDEALVAARSRLNPAAGVMLSALWVDFHEPAGADHSPSRRRRGVVANPVGGSQHRAGLSITADNLWRYLRRERRLPGGRRCWPSTRAARRSWNRRMRGGRSGPPASRCQQCGPRRTRSPVPGTCPWSSQPKRPECYWVRCQQRFTPAYKTFC